MNYSFGARLPRSGETYSQPRTDFQSRDDLQSRVEVQPAVTASSRSSSEAPSKMNYSFGARLPNRNFQLSVGVQSGVGIPSSSASDTNEANGTALVVNNSTFALGFQGGSSFYRSPHDASRRGLASPRLPRPLALVRLAIPIVVAIASMRWNLFRVRRPRLTSSPFT